MKQIRIGNGFDVHRFAPDRKLILGGIEIDHESGLDGHSDADVLIHAIMDALLGAIGSGDIGKYFPDSSSEFKDISSLILLSKVYEILQKNGASISNIDATVICEKPKISPYIDKMKDAITSVLPGVRGDQINIKGTTTEGLGFTGRKEGIAACAVALVTINGSKSEV